jgi:hypothetical protein
MWEGAEGDAAYAARRSTPWSVAWHALEIVDYDLTGDLAPFSPPPTFRGQGPLARPYAPAERVVTVRTRRIPRRASPEGERRPVGHDR